MTLQRRLTLRYLAIVLACLALLAGLAYHEFITEPRVRRELGQAKPSGSAWGEYAEMVLHSMIPVVLGAGWWLMRRTLLPIDQLARQVESSRPDDLGSPLCRSHNGDEVDRLTQAFNRVRKRLHRSFRQIREFTLDASHELKTPLSLMRLQIEAALEAPEPLPPAHRESLHQWLEEIQRLARIVDGLSLLAKADAGLVTLERHPLAWHELVREAFEDGEVLTQSQHLTLTLTACEPAVVLGDRDRLRQTLLNLVDNAVKYNRPGGRIAMSLRTVNHEALLEIRNTGEPIPAEVLPHIFERFVRGRTGSHTAENGTGLGLAIVHWIVEGHGGTVTLRSEPTSQPDDAETIVTVRLPLAPSSRPAA